MATRTFKTKGGKTATIKSRKKRSSGKYKDLPLGKCVMVPTGKGGKCQIKLCHTGKGATGWTFVKGSKTCSGVKRSRKARRR